MKLSLKPGDLVETMPGQPFGYIVRGQVLEVDEHPFEHAMVRIRLVDITAVLEENIDTWVSERYLRKVSDEINRVTKEHVSTPDNLKTMADYVFGRDPKKKS